MIKLNPFQEGKYTEDMSGKLVHEGEPLSRIQIPSIKTLVSRTPQEVVTIPMLRAQLIPEFNEETFDGDRLILQELEEDIFDISYNPEEQINPVEADTKFSRHTLPTTLAEARRAIPYISEKRAGNMNDVYSISEMKYIAQQLDCPTTGNKQEIANALLAKIRSYEPKEKK